MRAVVGALFFMVAMATLAADAAQITTAPKHEGEPDVFLIQGNLDAGDEQKFAAATAFSTSAIVLFHSNGVGNLAAGIEIGRAIRMKGFATVVQQVKKPPASFLLQYPLGALHGRRDDELRDGFLGEQGGPCDDASPWVLKHRALASALQRYWSRCRTSASV